MHSGILTMVISVTNNQLLLQLFWQLQLIAASLPSSGLQLSKVNLIIREFEAQRFLENSKLNSI